MSEKFIQLDLGKIDINSVPILETESEGEKLVKVFILFAFIITVILIILYLTDCNKPYEKHNSRQNLNEYLQPQMESMDGSIKATSIKLFANTNKLLLNNVIVTTTDGAVINYNTQNPNDIKSQISVKKYSYNNKDVYLINLQAENEIKHMYIISDSNPHNYIDHLYIDLMFNEVPVWHSTNSFGKNQQVNEVRVKTDYINPMSNAAYSVRAMPETPLLERADIPGEKIIINENGLAVQLSPDNDGYVSHSYKR
jgi:hypothetical protein